MEWRQWGRLGLAAVAAGMVGVGEGGGASIQNLGNPLTIDGKARALGQLHAKLLIDKPNSADFKIIWGDVTVVNNIDSTKAFLGNKKLWEFNDNCVVLDKIEPIYIEDEFLLAFCTTSTDLKYTYADKKFGRRFSIRGQPILRDNSHVYYLSALNEKNSVIMRRFSTKTLVDEEFFRSKSINFPVQCLKNSGGPEIIKFDKLKDGILIFRADAKICNFRVDVSLSGELTYIGVNK